MCNPGPSPSHYPGNGIQKSGFQPSSFPPSSEYPTRERFPPGSNSGGHHINSKESPAVPSVIKPSSAVAFVPNNKNPHHTSSSGDGMQSHSNNQSPKVEYPFTSVSFNSKDGDLHTSGQNECLGPRKVWARGACWIKCTAASAYLDHSDVGIGSSLFHPSEKEFARTYAVLWAILSLSASLIALTLSVCSPVI